MSSFGSNISVNSQNTVSLNIQKTRMIGWDEIIILAIAIASFVAFAFIFSNHQSIWTDETTQLSGIELPFSQQLTWLTGHFHSVAGDFIAGVPPDRMPPLSYWLGSLWAAIFGLSENSLRWMGIVAVCCAAPALYFSGRLIGGRAGGLLVLGLILFSGNIIIESVEIRAYPLFFSFSAWAAYFFILLVMTDDEERWRYRLTLLCFFLLLSIYTHFFGIVAAACILAALLTYRFIIGRTVGSVFLAGVAILVLSAGIVPFVLAAIGISDGVTAKANPSFIETLIKLSRLAFWLFLHPSRFAAPKLMAVFVAALTLLVAIAGVRLVIAYKQSNGAEPQLIKKFAALVLPVAFAFCGLTLVSVWSKGFEVLAPHYNIWFVPLLAVVPVFALREPKNGLSTLSIAGYLAATFAVGSNIITAATLLPQSSLYSHGPGEWAASLIKDPSSTLIVHDSRGDWGFLYFPLYFLTHGAVTQWVGDSEATMRRISPSGFSAIADPKAELAKFSIVLQERTNTLDSREVADIAKGNSSCAFYAPSISNPFKTWGEKTQDERNTIDKSIVHHFCSKVSTSIILRSRGQTSPSAAE